MKVTIKKGDLPALREKVRKQLKNAAKTGVRKTSLDTDVQVKKENLSLVKCIRGQSLGMWDGADAELAYFKKVANTLDGSSGGFLVPEMIASGMIELLRDKSVIRSMPGVRVIDVPNGTDTMVFNRQDSAASVTWSGEGETNTEGTNAAYGQVKAQLKKMLGMQDLTYEMVVGASESMESMVTMDLVEQMYLKEDLAFMYGTGGMQPLGIKGTPGVTSTTAATITEDALLNAMLILENNFSEATGFVTSPTVRNYLRKLEDSYGRKLLLDLTSSSFDSTLVRRSDLFGMPLGVTKQAQTTSGNIIVGRWSDMIICERPEIRIETTNVGGNSWAKDQISIRTVRYVDMVLRHPGSFTIIDGITA